MKAVVHYIERQSTRVRNRGYSVIYLERVHGVTMILITSSFKYRTRLKGLSV
jgi:hypothetical protein